jgi:hypothetical protein
MQAREVAQAARAVPPATQGWQRRVGHEVAPAATVLHPRSNAIIASSCHLAAT